MLYPALFLDRDGVLNHDIGYLSNPSDFLWIAGVADALKYARSLGFRLIVVTNQSGVARGFYDEAAVVALHEWMNRELAVDGLSIDAFYYCPFHEDAVDVRYRIADHPDRKPNAGMLLRAAAEHEIDLSRSAMVGDKPSDMLAAAQAGVRGLKFEGGNLHDFLADNLVAL